MKNIKGTKMFSSYLIYHYNLIISEVDYECNTMHATFQAEKHISMVIRKNVYTQFK